MNSQQFLQELVKLNWVLDQDMKNRFKDYDPNMLAAGRFAKAPDDLKELATLFDTCTNKEETIWLLSVIDYLGQSDAAFAWNEFELESLNAALPDEVPKIEKFWSSHLPFLLSVKNGYAYVAVVLDGKDKGSVIAGNEPEYEEVSKVASDITEFFDVFISFLKKEINVIPLSIFR